MTETGKIRSVMPSHGREEGPILPPLISNCTNKPSSSNSHANYSYSEEVRKFLIELFRRFSLEIFLLISTYQRQSSTHHLSWICRSFSVLHGFPWGISIVYLHRKKLTCFRLHLMVWYLLLFLWFEDFHSFRLYLFVRFLFLD